MAPARTGSDSSRSITVSIIDHANNGIRSIDMPFGRMFIMVLIKLILFMIDDAPARCREKIATSTDGPLCVTFLAKSGYTVHPVPAPFSTITDMININKDGNRSHSLMLFIRGNAMSGAPNINGSNQFRSPPMNMGITNKKIIRNAWAVMIVLYS